MDIQTALNLAETAICQLVEMKDKPQFDEIFECICERADRYGINRPSMVNRRGRTPNDANGNKRSRCDIDPNEKYHGLYVKTLDAYINHMSEKFNTDNYKPLIRISELLTSDTKPAKSDLFWDLSLYRKDDINIDDLDTELDTWIALKSKKQLELPTIPLVQDYFRQYNLKASFPNLFTLLVIFLTVPVSSTESERSFSVLKRIKTWLRSTMGQIRISALTLIHMNCDILRLLDIESMIDAFAMATKRRLELIY